MNETNKATQAKDAMLGVIGLSKRLEQLAADKNAETVEHTMRKALGLSLQLDALQEQLEMADTSDKNAEKVEYAMRKALGLSLQLDALQEQLEMADASDKNAANIENTMRDIAAAFRRLEDFINE